MTPAAREALIDCLQVILSRVQRAHVTAKQQAVDTSEALAAATRAAELLREGTPAARGTVTGRRTRHLDVAIVRTGRSIPEIGFLAGIPEPRLRNLIAGEAPAPHELERLRKLLPDWQPGGES